VAQRGIVLLVILLTAAALTACGEESAQIVQTDMTQQAIAHVPTEPASPEVAAGTATTTGSPPVVLGASPPVSPGASPVVAMVGDVERGRTLALTQCSGCHSVDGSTVVGPSWLGLYGSEVPLASGETVVADEAYLAQSIRDPNSQVVEGFPQNTMPSYSYFTDQQIADIIAYIKSLEG
jgi:cytochrome c oxidase subunit 2